MGGYLGNMINTFMTILMSFKFDIMFNRQFRGVLKGLGKETFNFRKVSTNNNQYPPTYFSNPNASPNGTPYNPVASVAPVENPTKSGSGLAPFRDLALCLAILGLGYFALDNYQARLALQLEAFSTTMKQQKALAMAQMTFNNARKKRELQILNERKNFQRREMKMALHIAMLRKQLEEQGILPVDINEALQEFEKNVKIENSLTNITGTSLWVVDESDLKLYVPSTHEYDRK